MSNHLLQPLVAPYFIGQCILNDEKQAGENGSLCLILHHECGQVV